MTLPRSHRALVVLALATVYVVWGSTYMAIRVGVHEIPPFTMAGIRFLSAGIPFYFWSLRRTAERPTRTMWLHGGGIGVLMLVGGNGLVTLAEKTVPSAIAALLITTVPLWMVLLDATVYRRTRLTVPVAIGLILGFGGVVVLMRPTETQLSTVPIFGSILLLLASFSWANGSLLSRRAILPRSNALATSIEMIVAGAVLFGIGLVRQEWSGFDPGAVSAKAWSAVAYLSVFGSILALSAYGWLLKNVSAAVVSTYAFVNPIVAVILGAWLLAEPMGPKSGLAGALIISAVVLIQLSGRQQARRERRRVAAAQEVVPEA